jgi:aryl-alcohol dehydrogenase-like predicted oxidoreductase
VHYRNMSDTVISAIGLGGSKFSLRDDRPREEDSIGVIQAALRAGVTVFDTATVYGHPDEEGHNEKLFAQALSLSSVDTSKVRIIAKGGQYWRGGEFCFDGRRANVRAACEVSLRALGVDRLWLYVLHRLPSHMYDPNRSNQEATLAESLEALTELQAAGKVEHIGVSNIDADTLDTALRAAPIAAIENQFTIGSVADEMVLRECEAADVAYFAWGTRRFFADPGSRAAADAVTRVARERAVSTHQVVIAALLAHSPRLIPLVGARRVASIADSAKGTELPLQPRELADIFNTSVASTHATAPGAA